MSANVLQATPDAAIAKGGILHQAFPGDTWGRWLSALRAAWGAKLSPEDEALFREIAGGREPPTTKVRELWVLAGRRSGKDAAASAILATTALQNWNPFLRPGERASCVCLASTVEQAQIVNRYVRSYFEQGPLARLVTAQTDDVLQLSTGAEIIIASGNFRSIRGKAVAIAVLDELCFWRGTDAANSDVELLAALTPALETLPGSMLVGISSPFKRSGVAYEKWARHFGKDDPDVLVLHGETRQFNPTVRQSTINAALEADPDRASSEWLGRWRDDVGAFIDRQLVESAVEPGVAARPPQFDAEYIMFVDPSGGRGSSFAACVAHNEGGIVYIDALFERRPPMDPDSVVSEVCALARQYRIGTVVGDNFGGAWPAEAFAKQGIIYIISDRHKSEIYLNTLPLFASGKIRLLDSPRLSHQFTQLERRNTTGRDMVRAPSGAADDLCNTCAGAAVNAVADGPALLRSASVFANAVPTPQSAQLLFSATTIGPDAMIATAYFALNKIDFGWPKNEIFLLDAALGPLTVGTAREIYQNLVELRALFRKGNQARRAFYPGALETAFVDAIAPYADAIVQSYSLGITSGIVEMDIEQFTETPRPDLSTLAVQFSSLEQNGTFKVTQELVAKSRNLPLAAALSFRPNERIEDSTLRLAILEGVRIGMLS